MKESELVLQTDTLSGDGFQDDGVSSPLILSDSRAVSSFVPFLLPSCQTAAALGFYVVTHQLQPELHLL